MTRSRKMKWASYLTAASIAVGIVAGLPADAAEPGAASQLRGGGTPKVKVVDNDFSKGRVGIKTGGKVKFKWSAGNRNPHQIVLQNGPDGVERKDFRSKLGPSGISFKPKFRKPGEYDLICIVHPKEMQIKVKVKKR